MLKTRQNGTIPYLATPKVVAGAKLREENSGTDYVTTVYTTDYLLSCAVPQDGENTTAAENTVNRNKIIQLNSPRSFQWHNSNISEVTPCTATTDIPYYYRLVRFYIRRHGQNLQGQQTAQIQAVQSSVIIKLWMCLSQQCHNALHRTKFHALYAGRKQEVHPLITLAQHIYWHAPRSTAQSPVPSQECYHQPDLDQ